MQRIFSWAHSHLVALRTEEGQTMAEYAVILALITAAVVGVMLALGTNILTVIETVTGYIVAG
jgi:Flp pilus assembly pilin Flp